MLRVRRIRTALPRAAGRPPSDPGAREPFLGLLQGRGVASASSMRVIRHARQSGPGAVYAASVTPDARGAGGQIGNRCCDRTDVRNPQVPVRCDLWPICHSKPQGGSISSNISNIACRHMSKGQQATLPACCFRCWRGSNASRAPSSLQAPHRPRRRPREHPSARAGGCSIACAAANRRRRLLGGRRLRTRKCRGRSSPGRGKGRGSRPFGFLSVSQAFRVSRHRACPPRWPGHRRFRCWSMIHSPDSSTCRVELDRIWKPDARGAPGHDGAALPPVRMRPSLRSKT
jgi:hypothetical protein